MAVQDRHRIVSDPDVLGGKPRIEGTRIGAHFVHERVEGRGLLPQTVADRHNLGIADVYRALTYYHDHPEEMREIERRREKALEEVERLEPPE